MSGDKPRYRGFQLSHQKVALQVDLHSGLLSGFTELTLLPSSPDLKLIYLNFRQGVVKAVTLFSPNRPVPSAPPAASSSTPNAAAPVPSVQAPFSHNDPLALLTLSNPKDPHIYPEAKRKAFAAYTEAEGGELAIRIEDGWVETAQPEIAPESKDATLGGVTSNGATTASPPVVTPAVPGEPSFLPLTLKIEYEVRAGGEGLAMFGSRVDEDDLVRRLGFSLTLIILPKVSPGFFLLSSRHSSGQDLIPQVNVQVDAEPNDASPFSGSFDLFACPPLLQHAPHIYTSATSPDAARCWIPCIDNLWERCTWELDFVVDRMLGGRRGESSAEAAAEGGGRNKGKAREGLTVPGSDEDDVEGNGRPIVVACSGELSEHVSVSWFQVDLLCTCAGWGVS